MCVSPSSIGSLKRSNASDHGIQHSIIYQLWQKITVKEVFVWVWGTPKFLSFHQFFPPQNGHRFDILEPKSGFPFPPFNHGDPSPRGSSSGPQGWLWRNPDQARMENKNLDFCGWKYEFSQNMLGNQKNTCSSLNIIICRIYDDIWSNRWYDTVAGCVWKCGIKPTSTILVTGDTTHNPQKKGYISLNQSTAVFRGTNSN